MTTHEEAIRLARANVLARANELAANSNFHIQGFEAHKLGNLTQAILEEFERLIQLAKNEAYKEAAKVCSGHNSAGVIANMKAEYLANKILDLVKE